METEEWNWHEPGAEWVGVDPTAPPQRRLGVRPRRTPLTPEQVQYWIRFALRIRGIPLSEVFEDEEDIEASPNGAASAAMPVAPATSIPGKHK
jgi:hypothetical protein